MKAATITPVPVFWMLTVPGGQLVSNNVHGI